MKEMETQEQTLNQARADSHELMLQSKVKELESRIVILEAQNTVLQITHGEKLEKTQALLKQKEIELAKNNSELEDARISLEQKISECSQLEAKLRG